MDWNKANEWERSWWGDCVNTFGEEQKQLTYAKKMGLVTLENAGRYPLYDLKGASVVDVGGGPVSMLLKTANCRGTVIDPCDYPDWVSRRYVAAGIEYRKEKAEDMEFSIVADEMWCYNVLQHVIDPERIIYNMRRFGKTIRLFEWIDIPAYTGHIHELKMDVLDGWLNGKGSVEDLNENGCIGRAYFGAFEGV